MYVYYDVCDCVRCVYIMCVTVYGKCVILCLHRYECVYVCASVSRFVSLGVRVGVLVYVCVCEYVRHRYVRAESVPERRRCRVSARRELCCSIVWGRSKISRNDREKSVVCR